jgi:hypothetical protein
VVAITGGGTGLTYDPTGSYLGGDTFTYTIQDPGGLSDTATVSLQVAKDTTGPVVTAPISSIRTLVQLQSTYMLGRFTWTGSDAGVGLASFTLQRSLNGGTYTTMTLSTAKATTFNATLVIGNTYRFRVRGTDLNGNVSAWMYGPSLVASRYQESSTLVKYGGTWSTATNVNNSGGATRYTSVALRYTQITLTARDYAFVAPRLTTSGSARIYVDGVQAAFISLKSTTGSTVFRQVLWSKHFAIIGSHTIKIVVYGNGRVDLDCFLALR